jgi:Fe-S cluster biogenesis protein NfuA
MINNIEARINDVLKNVNWLMESHDSYAELVSIEGNDVVIRCVGHCAGCDTNCVRAAFSEQLPEVDLVIIDEEQE